MQKIIILIIVVTFIPIAVYVYDARRIDVSPEMQTAYSTISQQVNSQGFLVALKNIPQCQPPSNMLCNCSPYAVYSSCYDRCLRGSTCFLTPSNQSCLLSNNYLSNTSKICTSQPVVNQIDSSSATFWLNTSRTPLSQISIINGTLSLEYYCILNVSACEAALSFFGSSLEDVYNINYIKFHAVGVYLMNYGLIPLVIHIIVVLLLDLCFKFNLRLTNSLLVIHEGLIGIGLIFNGFTFNEQNDDIQTAFNSITQYCLIKDNSYCYSTLYQLF